MNLFQWLSFAVLGCLIAIEWIRRLTGRDRGFAWGLRVVLWMAAVVSIAWPNLLTRIAATIGIHRGADLVAYVFILAFLGTTFYFYSRYVRLEQQLTHVVRHLAMESAQRGRSKNDDLTSEAGS
jgi:hypothetical protein